MVAVINDRGEKFDGLLVSFGLVITIAEAVRSKDLRYNAGEL
jgi:hypothetical protein